MYVRSHKNESGKICFNVSQPWRSYVQLLKPRISTTFTKKFTFIWYSSERGLIENLFFHFLNF